MQGFAELFGGIGLFLFGMATMTAGLRSLAGDRLRLWLQRSTRNPATGAMTGAAVTALIQSSSATTLAAIGFVGAGLLTFSQALGIVFGANIGTTLTGWMVALLGFKLKLTTAALPLLFVAAALYLFKERRLVHASGKALAGFSLIFIGIGFLQDGLDTYRDVLDFSRWPAHGLGGRLLLLLFGMLLTIVTQSSSATVATVVTALHASVLTLPQGAAVVIGADIGTTVTAGLAAIGAPTASQRTGFAHIFYNILTGIMALLILPVFLWAGEKLAPAFLNGTPEVAVVAFHSFFNTLGVILILPFTRQFAKVIERIVPDREVPLTQSLNPRLLSEPNAALAALEEGVRIIGAEALRLGAGSLSSQGVDRRGHRTERVFEAIPQAREFALRISQRDEEGDAAAERIFACLHLIDQIDRLVQRSQDHELMKSLALSPELEGQAQTTATLLRDLAESLACPVDLVEKLQVLSNDLEKDKGAHRQSMIRGALTHKVTAQQLDEVLDAQRWIRRMAYHAWRVAHYAEELSPGKKGV